MESRKITTGLDTKTADQEEWRNAGRSETQAGK